VRVLVADRDLQRGDRLDIKSVKWVQWPEQSVSEQFITETSGAKPEDFATAVARTEIVAGQPIINDAIVRPDSGGQMAAILTPGMRAVSMRVTPETASGGFVLPGDRVDVMYTDGARGAGSTKTRTIFENVRVLAVNNLYAEKSDVAYVEGVNITLELSPEDAESFVTARSSGALSLALRSIFKPEGEVESQTKRSSDVTVIRYGRS
ncbi:MAG TPA: Flp pilus assembly protein CpaB, partial [Parvularculaceae bacterium]|nr:Flp pilus assembly protein CpaB [Parvularculaceae bacterium]